MKTLSFMLIEDDLIETLKFNRVLKSFKSKHKIIEVKNGEEALELLSKEENNLPDVIILDLNMPKINGLEFLKILKKDKTLKYIPVVILTTSNNQQDLHECYKCGIAGYIEKPLHYNDYVTKIKALIDYWSINEQVNL